MGEPAIFSLGPKGIITAPEELMRMLFMHAFEADHSQSTLPIGLHQARRSAPRDFHFLDKD